MKFPSLYLTGNIITADILDKLGAEHLPGQQVTNFGFEKGVRIREEIGKAWADANDYWRIYKRKLDAAKEGNRFTTETRNLWLIPLLNLLGYEPEFSNAEIINEKTYEISYRDKKRAGLPLLLVSYYDDLDKKPDNARLRMSPHALMQDYLNATEHTYGLVSNGKTIRLLRDSGRISKLSYVEFDLQQIFDDSIFADFAVLFRLLHGSRMPLSPDKTNESFIEQYHLISLEEGGRIREALSGAVEKAIKGFANGLLHENKNTFLHEHIKEGLLSAEAYYQNLLRLVYRMLFLMVVEERKLVFPEKLSETQRRFSDIYYQHYSLQRLRFLVGNKQLVQQDKYDIWMLLLQVFAIYEDNDKAKKLGLQSLGSDLFSPNAISWLRNTHLSNKVMLECLFHLSYFTDKQTGAQHKVNYAALNVEEFGSVYEGLLDYQPEITLVNDRYSFGFKNAKEGRAFQSHYSPEELVQPLIKHSLDYLLADRKAIIDKAIKENKLAGLGKKQEREQLVQTHIYSLKVCDVACGSGHILISAARRIAEVAASIIEEEEQPNPSAYRRAKREAIRQCIYGVDKNPMAVELCKVALWLEAHIPGEPLNFLDHHIKWGDAIVGLAHHAELENGIADEAFKTLPGDDKKVASDLLRRNKAERKAKDQLSLELKTEIQNEVNEALAEYENFNQLPETTPEEIKLKEKGYKKFERKVNQMRIPQLADAMVAQFFIPKTEANKDKLITDAEYRKELKRNDSAIGGIQNTKFAHSSAVAAERGFFHWFIQFPDVFRDGGFDCVLGNPPYLGGTKISTNYGIHFSYYLLSSYSNTSGLADLVSYFIKRNTSLLKSNAFFNIITTDSVSQGATRLSALEELLDNGSIIFAIKSTRWPGTAAVNVALIGFYKGKWKRELFLNGQKVEFINSLLGKSDEDNNTNELFVNHNKSYTGSKVYGEGFVLTKEKANELISLDSKNEIVIKPYLTGDDIANEIGAVPSRFVINFQSWPLGRYSKNEWLELPSILKNEINDRVFN